MRRRPRRPSEPWLGGKTGGVSGPAVRAIALSQVREVRARVALPVIGMGGVQSGRHAVDLQRAGADIVAVGTESFRDPLAARRIAAEASSQMEGFPANTARGVEVVPIQHKLTAKALQSTRLPSTPLHAT